ncbi:hypothetical protein LTR10_019595 [Elasticomyces elasticus]|uniref:Trafficking protein particle complex subunit 11 domain-containing protein n=1 Tax=Exophiala sideris TaxID=1016849 RepID=A0ABR0JNR7_9EURO|nr:hypothetical protein LTR10_019595 [Elasticomyces elasticus]KAK5038139.1 hypothetical protein LTS07_001608 [Exophiala sideris]KAK5044123.1 hypothetical protein LTR13_000479 [Exophiala sideris]KAK5067623.1 hypothetical protein LTR69_001612 [Exophiala sideris]KAK5184138.1 hypothetical protein LTR44_003644 [Eurotiomycetes sp. CCFEE 6388]
MDGIEQTPSSSKVIIQCVDPNNLYDSLEPRLAARAPLRNLHWKSPNRPLRSIPSLNISLQKEDKSTGSQGNARRHQIPGLRETPYVKLYILRCDDKETYKEKVRKEVRQWVKSQTPAGDGKSSNRTQEDHDAFEWLILHVVLPNTPAASQPKSSKHISLETTDSTDSVNSKSKWSGKSSSTIFDKLRADFSSGSKSSINRVAQVRLLDPSDKTTPLTPTEIEEQWQDLTESLKACILRSFDARVAQYETDIRERHNQRNLPGWNFCTFFVLKEGLAKGFESVGLLDDALAVYDELSLGLDSLVNEQAQEGDRDDSGALLDFSRESKNLLRAALGSESAPVPQKELETSLDLPKILIADRADFPFDVERKKYLNLILSNDVSALDLRIYLFTREMDILLRQGRQELTKSSGKTTSSANLNAFANVTERAISFINLAARSLRLELYSAWGGQEGLTSKELHTQRTVTGNIVSTLESRAAMQILSQVLPVLGLDVEYGTEWLSLDSVELSRMPGNKSNESPDARNHLNRMSLALDSGSPSRERSHGPHKRISVIPEEESPRQLSFTRPGSELLALWVFKLAIIARNAMADLEAVRPWLNQMKHNALDIDRHTGSTVLNGHDVNHRENHEDEDDQTAETHPDLLAGIGSSTLQTAASSKSASLNMYTMLSILAYRVIAGSRSHTTAQQVLTDLVELEYSQENYTLAARYLHSILGQLPQASYRPSDGHLLLIYADCLKHLDKPGEYARCLIACLQCASQGRFGSRLQKLQPTYQLFQERLFEVAHAMKAMTFSLSTLFVISSVDSIITQREGKDGFMLSFTLRTSSGTSTPPISDAKLRLTSQDGIEPRFISLKLCKEVCIEPTGTQVMLETAVTTHGWYIPDEVEVSIGNLRLLHHFRATHHDDPTQLDETPTDRSPVVPILIYPFDGSLEIKLSHAPVIHLGETRRILMQILPRRNKISQGRIRLKTATAGLRLNIHETKSLDDERAATSLRTAREGDAQIIIFDDLEADTTSRLEVPYTMEVQSEPAVTIRVDANYQTEQGTYTLYDTAIVSVILPVAVTVQDIFRSSSESAAYATTTGGEFGDAQVVFPKQPATWTVRLVPKLESSIIASQRMTLCVHFQSLDDLILSTLEENFTSEFMKTPHRFATRLLLRHLLKTVRTSWTEQDLEVAALTQAVEIWNMDDMNWNSVLCAFERTTRTSIEEWLSDWHSQMSTIKFSAIKTAQRQLRLHVDVPSHPVLVAACLEVKGLNLATPTATLGQPILADLTMSLANTREKNVEASFEIATSESWLVGGKRKGNVKLTRDPIRIPVILFPQHQGHALLPSVSVKCRQQGQGTGDEDAWTDVASDIFNPMHGRSILIGADTQSTTVEVSGRLPDGGTGRLVASARREESG